MYEWKIVRGEDDEREELETIVADSEENAIYIAVNNLGYVIDWVEGDDILVVK